MRILIHGINYAPELTGIGKYTGEMAAWLAKQGHQVTVITAPPYYPEWQVHDAYKGKKWHREKKDGVEVFRVPLYVPAVVNSKKRIIHEFSFLSASQPIWLKMLARKKYDVVFCIAPPFHLGFMPLLYGKIKGVPVITHIQDLQVDAAKELGMIKNERFLKIMFGMERYILRKSARVSTISDGMMARILKKGVASEKTIMFPNWVDAAVVRPLSKELSLRAQLGIPMEDKVILYSGNLGEKQGLEIILDIADDFRQQKDVHFLIVGSGGAKEKLQQMAQERQLEQVRFFPLQPYEKLSALLATADVHLVLQKKSAADLVMPSKLTGILAAGGCAIVTAEPGTSLFDVVRKHDMAIISQPESTKALKAAIATALDSTASQSIKGNARKYAEQFLAAEQILSTFERELRTVAQQW